MTIKPKKSLGQNFLIDKNIIKKISDVYPIKENSEILEIGPGTGNLTEKILEKNPKYLIVVEKDKDLSILLKKKFTNKVEVVNEDILKYFDKINFDLPVKVFGNLPYNISTKILVSFIRTKNLNNRFKKFIFIFQKEVADRILAQTNSKNYGRLSILSNWKLFVKKVFNINSSCFNPKPKVQSTLLMFSPRKSYPKLENSKNLEFVTRIFFNQRRKKIKKPLNQLFKKPNEIVEKFKLNINLRPQNLSPDIYYKIAKEYEKLRK